MGDEPTYLVMRIFQKGSIPNQIIKTGLTKAQAQAHCRNKETSSTTCTLPENVARTKKYGHWFDGFNQEKSGV